MHFIQMIVLLLVQLHDVRSMRRTMRGTVMLRSNPAPRSRRATSNQRIIDECYHPEYRGYYKIEDRNPAIVLLASFRGIKFTNCFSVSIISFKYAFSFGYTLVNASFPRYLRELTLVNIALNWDKILEIITISKLPNLQKLRLNNKASFYENDINSVSQAITIETIKQPMILNNLRELNIDWEMLRHVLNPPKLILFPNIEMVNVRVSVRHYMHNGTQILKILQTTFSAKDFNLQIRYEDERQVIIFTRKNLPQFQHLIVWDINRETMIRRLGTINKALHTLPDDVKQLIMRDETKSLEIQHRNQKIINFLLAKSTNQNQRDSLFLSGDDIELISLIGVHIPSNIKQIIFCKLDHLIAEFRQIQFPDSIEMIAFIAMNMSWNQLYSLFERRANCNHPHLRNLKVLNLIGINGYQVKMLNTTESIYTTLDKLETLMIHNSAFATFIIQPIKIIYPNLQQLCITTNSLTKYRVENIKRKIERVFPNHLYKMDDSDSSQLKVLRLCY